MYRVSGAMEPVIECNFEIVDRKERHIAGRGYVSVEVFGESHDMFASAFITDLPAP